MVTTRDWLKKPHDHLTNPITITEFTNQMDDHYGQNSAKSRAQNPWTKPFLYVVTGHHRPGDMHMATKDGFVSTADANAKWETQKAEGKKGWKVGVAHGKAMQKTYRLKSYQIHWGETDARIGYFQVQPNAHYGGRQSVLLRKEKLLRDLLDDDPRVDKWQGREWYICTARDMRKNIHKMEMLFAAGDTRQGFNGRATRFSPRVKLAEEIMFDFARELLEEKAYIKCHNAQASSCELKFKPMLEGEARRYILERRGQT